MVCYLSIDNRKQYLISNIHGFPERHNLLYIVLNQICKCIILFLNFSVT